MAMKKDPSGYSLLELVVCCALIGLTALLGMNAFHEMIPGARANRAARAVAGLLEWARWSAVEQGRVFRVELDPSGNRLRVYKEAENRAEDKGPTVVKDLDIAESFRGVVMGAVDKTRRTSSCRYVKASGIHFRDNTVRFLPTGNPDRCGALYLIPEKDLTGRTDRMFAISVILATGRLQLWRYDPYAESVCGNQGGAWSPQY